MKHFFTLLLILTATTTQAQVNAEAEPKGGEALVAIVYYKIDFTRDQLEYLRTHEAELIFSVGENGKAVLEKVNDIEDRAIIDSMMRVNDQLPEFFPKTIGGRAVNSVYFMKLGWPHFQPPQQQLPFQPNMPYMMAPYVQPGPAHGKTLKQFESYSWQFRYDMTIGGTMTSLEGSAANYSQSGGGVKFDGMFYGKNGWGGGFGAMFYSLNRIRPYPGTSLSGSSRMPSTFISLNAGKVFERKHVDVIVQFEPAFVMQEVASSDISVTPFNERPSVVCGFSPGVTLSVAVPIGPGRMNQYYYYPTAIRHFLNVHVGIRPLLMNYKEASGVLVEAGLSYRLMLKHVNDYKLK